ncbi:alpha-L-arabinofuranosidase C-terminal domain-containing protein [Microbacterium sp. GXF0217]
MTFDIRIGAPTGASIPADLWGLFLEDLNDALDGGLNAELVQNGDFQYSRADRAEWGPLTCWQVRSDAVTRVAWAREEDPVHPNNATHLRVTGPAVLANEGWNGIPVRASARQSLRLWARQVDGAAELAVAVRRGENALTDAAIVAVSSAEWTEYGVELDGRADGSGELEIAVPDGVVVDIDLVSLRPIGADGEPQIFRSDIVDALRALEPSFVRFPGGCLVHGTSVDSIYAWKNTIGPRETRRPMPNLWGYHQSMAIGYFEYFLLCEQLGATPLPVVAAGVCCQNALGGQRAVPETEMAAYIQDVLDLVEFADGAADTRWGAVRAELGHPEPFGLRYLGLGNEDAITPRFRDRYARIEDAVRARHPELTVIGTAGPFADGADFDAGWDFARERGVDIVDEHFYRAPRWFHQNVDRYASYDRGGPGVYLGEYAARSNRLRSALAEAAFLIGVERNADVVRLASYAPLLASVGRTAWTPDLIHFDAEEVLPSSSYHVQRMFSVHRGETVLSVDADLPVVPVVEPSAGTVRFAATGGAVELADIVIDGIRHPDLAIGSSQDAAAGAVDPRAVEVSFLLTRTSDDGGFEVRIGEDEPGDALVLQLGGWQGVSTGLIRHADGISDDDAEPLHWQGLRTARPVAVRISLSSPRVRVWVDGVLRHDYERDLRPEQRIVAGAAARGDETVARLVNATPEERTVRVQLSSEAAVEARVEVLTGDGPDDGGPGIPHPAPAVWRVPVRDGILELTLPAWSFTVAVIR